jgi:hypothetical protein
MSGARAFSSFSAVENSEELPPNMWYFRTVAHTEVDSIGLTNRGSMKLALRLRFNLSLPIAH